MSAESDKRVANASFLRGQEFTRKPYRAPGPAWDHDHCAACWAKFAETDEPGVQHEGFTTTGAYLMGPEHEWICVECFNELRQLLQWREVKSSPAGAK